MRFKEYAVGKITKQNTKLNNINNAEKQTNQK